VQQQHALAGRAHRGQPGADGASASIELPVGPGPLVLGPLAEEAQDDPVGVGLAALAEQGRERGLLTWETALKGCPVPQFQRQILRIAGECR
jgi:hypothetical protein